MTNLFKIISFSHKYFYFNSFIPNKSAYQLELLRVLVGGALGDAIIGGWDPEGLGGEGGGEDVGFSWEGPVRLCWWWGRQFRGRWGSVFHMRHFGDNNLGLLRDLGWVRQGWSVLLGDGGNDNWHTWLIVDVGVLVEAQVGHESEKGKSDCNIFQLEAN